MSKKEKVDPKKADLVNIRLKDGRTIKVAREAAGQFQGFLYELEASGYKIRNAGGYSYRSNVNAPSQMSKHSYGWAIDINPDTNPNIKGAPSMEHRIKNVKKYTDMDVQFVSALAKKWGLGWGFEWKNTSDAMHFSAVKNEYGELRNLPFDEKNPYKYINQTQGSSDTPQQEAMSNPYETQSQTPQVQAPQVQAPEIAGGTQQKTQENSLFGPSPFANSGNLFGSQTDPFANMQGPFGQAPKSYSTMLGGKDYDIFNSEPSEAGAYARSVLKDVVQRLYGGSMMNSRPIDTGVQELFDTVDLNDDNQTITNAPNSQ